MMELSRDLDSILPARKVIFSISALASSIDAMRTEDGVDEFVEPPGGIVMMQSTSGMHAPGCLNELGCSWILFVEHLLFFFLLNVQRKARALNEADGRTSHSASYKPRMP